VAYPESVAPDWKEQLKLSGLQCAISPLHDKDEHSDPAVEDGKKPHWHVIVTWGNTTTHAAVASLTDRLQATMPIKLESVRGYYRYFVHADDPDKYQYDPAEITLIGGFDIADHTEMTRGERLRLMAEVQDFIEDNDIREYRRLTWALRQIDGMRQQWEIAITNTLFFNTYITSRRHEIEQMNDKD
jgi:hypothetical protein